MKVQCPGDDGKQVRKIGNTNPENLPVTPVCCVPDNYGGLSEESSYQKLRDMLREVGIETLGDLQGSGRHGFPLAVPTSDGGTLVFDLPSPALLSSLNTDQIGLAVLDPLGFPRVTWGLAKRISFLKGRRSVLESPIGGLLQGSYDGAQGALYYEGYRYFSASLPEAPNDVLLLVVNAQEEQHAKKQASKSWRMANALKRLGKTLTMNQTLQPLCVAVAHEIASSAELAAVLLWTNNSDEGVLDLAASVGVNRQGTNVLGRLSTGHAAGCLAEFVAMTGQAFSLGSVLDHILTANTEALCCYLKPGPVNVQPLVISGKMLGVLEFIGREGDSHFEENGELFETVAEHLALALNSAAIFENFERLASRDPLTGLANHRTLQEFLHQRLLESERTEQEVGLIMVDVDHFRSFNEEEGHDAGDEVLRMVADALKACLRPYDLAARYGGEEFTVVMPGTNKAGLVAAAERMRRKVGAITFTTRSGQIRHVTASFGCACYPDTASDSAGLLKAADVALFEAKRSGRDRVAFFEGHLEGQSKAEAIPASVVRKWLTKAEFQEGEERLEHLADHLQTLAAELTLSESQQSILKVLLLLAPNYEGMTPDRKAKVQKSDAFRLLQPSLEALHERFDGEGPGNLAGRKIPLLARVVSVLLSLEFDKGRSLLGDPTRFDPEIVGCLGDLRQAA